MDCKQPNDQTSAEMADVLSFVTTGNARPLLHEIRHALDKLLAIGETTIIDLGALPFGPGDARELEDILGQGEIDATMTIMGRSHVRETGVPGVWRIDHFDEEDEVQSRFIEITFMPDILKTQREDAERGLEHLRERLAELEGNRQT